jgi:NAD(P)-dependent dehydrogenase (short-subunit alcohol dehydrogenase family)
MSEPDSEACRRVERPSCGAHACAGCDVRVNCISPGWIETKPDIAHLDADGFQHPSGRVGVPQDIADLAAYLIFAGFVTGQNFTADGGMTRKIIYEE